MDAWVPIKKPVAWVAMWLFTDHDEAWNITDHMVLTDLMWTEDFIWDMDFKVAWTRDWVNAIQLDTKLKWLPLSIVFETIDQAFEWYNEIMDVMLETLPAPRDHVGKYAPKIQVFKINPDKIKDVIGSGGKVINKIIEDTGVKIDIEDDGSVFIYSDDIEGARKAQAIIEEITREIELDGIYTGKVSRIVTFGAFVDLGGGKEGLLHISKISKERVNKVEDVFKVGDEVTVKVYEIDDQGRINLTRNFRNMRRE